MKNHLLCIPWLLWCPRVVSFLLGKTRLLETHLNSFVPSINSIYVRFDNQSNNQNACIWQTPYQMLANDVRPVLWMYSNSSRCSLSSCDRVYKICIILVIEILKHLTSSNCQYSTSSFHWSGRNLLLPGNSANFSESSWCGVKYISFFSLRPSIFSKCHRLSLDKCVYTHREHWYFPIKSK